MHFEQHTELDNLIAMQNLRTSANKGSNDAYDVSTSLTFSGATSRSNNTAELPGFAEALRRIDSVIPSGERVRILYDSEHAARVALGVAHTRKNIVLASRCNDLFLRSKGKLCWQRRE